MRTKTSLGGNIFAWVFAFISIAPFVYVLALSFLTPKGVTFGSVSYTHLTLPTICSV